MRPCASVPVLAASVHGSQFYKLRSAEAAGRRGNTVKWSGGLGGGGDMWAVNLPYMLLSMDMPAEQGNSIYTASLEAACFEWVLQATAR